MCRSSIFTRVRAMISNFLITCISKEFLSNLFHRYNTLSHLRVILTLCLLTATLFSFQKQLFFVRVLLNNYETFSCNLFHGIKYVCFYMVKFPDCRRWISARNMLSNFCWWIFFRIICTSIYFLTRHSRLA